jgi:hypothetical protein
MGGLPAAYAKSGRDSRSTIAVHHDHSVHPHAVGRSLQVPEPCANAFEDFWSAYARADRDGDPNSPQLARTATGAALIWARSQIADHVKLGVAHRGGAAFRSGGAAHVTSTSALIGPCMDWSTWPVVDRRTGAVFQQFAACSQLVDSRMAFADSHWRVATVRVRDVPC